MNDTVLLPQTYTPDQVARILQLSTNTVYDLINRGEILAKRIGKTLRISKDAISFAFTGLDADLYRAEREDLKNLPGIEKAILKIRASKQ
ncbi:helix-turn-helix domain-containing protein [Candidatus Gottesmanbacteria bacterium]|nr:helix-turn-helix domain-containing protein [Candidatus Gottesmanbacteria bacterium]